MRERIEIWIFRIFTKICEYILNRYTAFLTHVDKRQFPRQMPVYIEKKHYQVGKKVAHVGFAWHPNTLFQSNDILVGHLSLVENTVESIHFQDNNKCPLIVCNLLIFLLSCRFEWSRHNICRAHLLLIFQCTKNEVFH